MLFSDDENAPHTAKKEVAQRKKERTVKLDFITTLKRRTSMSMRQATVPELLHAESDSVSTIRPMWAPYVLCKSFMAHVSATFQF